jgi:hypothetical protein
MHAGMQWFSSFNVITNLFVGKKVFGRHYLVGSKFNDYIQRRFLVPFTWAACFSKSLPDGSQNIIILKGNTDVSVGYIKP